MFPCTQLNDRHIHLPHNIMLIIQPPNLQIIRREHILWIPVFHEFAVPDGVFIGRDRFWDAFRRRRHASGENGEET